MAPSRVDLAYVALASVPGIGPSRLKTLLDCFATAAGALAAPWGQLLAVPGISRAAASAIKKASIESAAGAVARTEELGGFVLTLAGHSSEPRWRFPEILRTIPDPPPVLYALGETALLHREAVAVVGSREHSSYGARACSMLVSDFARAGLVVVSGMARGIDAIAHSAALDAGGPTVGVLGNGLGVVYPAANRALYERVVSHGCLVTEFPPGERPNAGSFPRRNRLISGLSRMTLVVEARARSGALITADCALNQGREVAAVPGPITSPMSEGCNRLIASGARPVLDAADVLDEFGLSGSPAPAPVVSAGARPVVEALRKGPIHVDQLALDLGTPVGPTLAALTALELQGVVARDSGKVYRLR